MNIYTNQKLKIFDIFIFLMPTSITYVMFADNKHLQLIILTIIYIELIKNYFLENYYLKNFIKPILNKKENDDLINLIVNIFIFFSLIFSLILAIIIFLFGDIDYIIIVLYPLLIINSILLFFLKNYKKKYYFITRSLTALLIIIFFNFNYAQSYISETLLIVFFINFLEVIILLNLFLKKKRTKVELQILNDFRFLYFAKQYIKVNLIKEKFKLVFLLILFFLILFKIYENKIILL